MNVESVEQLIGIIVGGLLGYIVAAAIAGGSYRYVGGDLWEVVEDPMGCIPGCLLEIVLAIIGAGVGFLVGSLLAG